MTTEHAFRDRRRRSRTKLYRRALAGLGVLVLAQGLAACGGGGESSSTATGSTAAGGGPKGVLTIGVSSGGSVDPVANIGGNCTVVASGNCELWNESIVHRDPSARLVPGLATRWGFVGSGNRVFEFVLRQDARFSDGEPVTAEAMKTWINYYYNAPGAIQRGQLGTISSIETPDRWTVRINMARPNPAIPFAMLALGAQSPKCVATPAKLRNRTCGAGPYMLDPTQTVADDHYTFVPNPYYYDKSKIHFTKVVSKVITTPSAMLQALRTGQIQVAPGDPTTYKAAKAAGIAVTPLLVNQNLYAWDVAGKKSKPLGDVRVRQALNYAIDRKAIAEAFGGEGSVPLSTWLSSDGNDGSSDGDNSDYVDYYDYDPAKAKQLLSEAGYPDGFTIDGADITGFGGDGPNVIPITQAIAKNFEAVGVKLNYKPSTTFGSWISKISSDPAPLISNTAVPSTYPMWVGWGFIEPGAFFNRIGRTGWNDAELTRIMREGSVAEDPTPYWRAASARMTEQALFLFVVRAPKYVYAAENIGGASGPSSVDIPDLYMKSTRSSTDDSWLKAAPHALQSSLSRPPDRTLSRLKKLTLQVCERMRVRRHMPAATAANR